ncbi:hypothetical protein CAPTEDRAFT_202559 [Capitella teleta]|uniref:LRRCT domain-containing protein n=1 Tax=Capitella teleta TaxID=283909 RepID=R7V9V8_CAPTE|nr:hypothetical protein CAPTEDRAFT_202559 [Capitella teleta]|eukprot:ELU13121.1 hypothetical protein CAPTEDRAFT_202559 [Capitella teleta]
MTMSRLLVVVLIVFSYFIAVVVTYDNSTLYINLDNQNHPVIRHSYFNDKFPNLASISLQSCQIVSIEDGCFSGTKLRNIKLKNNQLTTFPDFRLVNRTLEVISIINNKVTEITSSDIGYLLNLTALYVGGNPLIRILEFPKFLPSLVAFGINTTPLSCCWDKLWLKGDELSTSFSNSSTPCHEPSALVGVTWMSITRETLSATPCGIHAIIKSADFHPRRLSKIHRHMNKEACTKLVLLTGITRIDYHNDWQMSRRTTLTASN